MSKQGVLLINLGSPNSPSVRHVRRYLREFLMDGRVLDAPWPIRFFIVHCCILPTRPKQSAEAYHKIWTSEGSPLVITSRKVQAELQKRFDMPVELAMRYQQPSVSEAIENLRKRHVTDLLVIPMFPHFAMSSFETAAEHVKHVAGRIAPEMKVRIAPPYYDDPYYIKALVASAQPYLEDDYDHLLFSFHGIPERHLRKANPACGNCLRVEGCCTSAASCNSSLQVNTCYRVQCFKTAEAFVRRARVTRYSVAFQSRLGREAWLQPYTDAELIRLPRDGIRKLLVICPAFVADCLETIEEIGMRGRDTFLSAGGKQFTLIPCLNDHPLWIEALGKMIPSPCQRVEPLTQVKIFAPA
jgi:ferrochelatase